MADCVFSQRTNPPPIDRPEPENPTCTVVFLKSMRTEIAPDIAEEDVEPIAARLVANKVDGIEVSNTTLTRPGLRAPEGKESGGLSGRPLMDPSTQVLFDMYQLTQARVPIIGVNRGSLGFLTTLSADDIAAVIFLYGAVN